MYQLILLWLYFWLKIFLSDLANLKMANRVFGYAVVLVGLIRARTSDLARNGLKISGNDECCWQIPPKMYLTEKVLKCAGFARFQFCPILKISTEFIHKKICVNTFIWMNFYQNCVQTDLLNQYFYVVLQTPASRYSSDGTCCIWDYNAIGFLKQVKKIILWGWR